MLERHALSSGSAARRIEARVRRLRDALEVSYVVEGDLDRVEVPPPRPPSAGERLWEHTCCELFVARKGAPDYEEFNFSPSGEWACFSFSDYRKGGPAVRRMRPAITVRRIAERLVLEARVPLSVEGGVVLGLSAVIEEQGGALSYWALRHPPGKPDFHHRDSFALELDEVRD